MKKILSALFAFLSLGIYAENITVVGIGKLGLCQALCLEKAGYSVLGVDLSKGYIDSLNDKTFRSHEPLVNEYLLESVSFRATTSLEEGLAFSDLIFLVVPTNHLQNAEPYDPIALTEVLTAIGRLGVENKMLVITSTVPPGYIRSEALPLIAGCRNITLSYNPEFIAQGEIIQGLTSPDLVLIGEAGVEEGDRIEGVYRKMCANTPSIQRMSVDSAEITKMALNCFVTAKITFANIIGDIADETPGADKFAILAAIGKDSRVGSKYLKPGYGFGGPCFPRDNRALAKYAASVGIDNTSLKAVDQMNKWHANYMARKFLASNAAEFRFEDVCYKSNCSVPIIEESQKLAVARQIAEAGRTVTIVDRKEILDKVEEEFGNLFQYEIRQE